MINFHKILSTTSQQRKMTGMLLSEKVTVTVFTKKILAAINKKSYAKNICDGLRMQCNDRSL